MLRGWRRSEGRGITIRRIDFTRNALGPGNAVLLFVECEHVTEVFSSFGERGLPAERVGMNVAQEAKAWLDSGAPVGMHLADQLLVPLAMAGGGAFRASEATDHARTVIDVARRFVDVSISVEERAKGDVHFAIAR